MPRWMNVFVVLVLVGATLWYFAPAITGQVTLERPTITVATWNIENFGQKKAMDDQVMDQIANIIDEYDLVAIQEVSNVDERQDVGCSRNEDACPGPKCGLIHEALSSRLKDQNYSILISDQVMDERYLIVFKNTSVRFDGVATLLEDAKESGHPCDLRPEDPGLMRRQPFAASFTAGNFSFWMVTAHTSPSNNDAEIQGLSAILSDHVQITPKTILVGDLNLDCSYAPKDLGVLASWHQVTRPGLDTTVSKSKCTYDQIFVSPSIQDRSATAAKADVRVTDALSDHYLVYSKFFID